jgi:Arc/MetJ-type ribon-helix-helix transcriptional regulator
VISWQHGIANSNEIEKAIAQHLATGKYASAEDVVLTALKRLEEDDTQYQATIESLHRSLADEAAGRLSSLSDAAEDLRKRHATGGQQQA